MRFVFPILKIANEDEGTFEILHPLKPPYFFNFFSVEPSRLGTSTSTVL